MPVFTTLCPAKLNLGLRVLGHRPDGYHELDTLFCQLELADRLMFIPGGHEQELIVRGRSIDCRSQDNLVLDAVRAFSSIAGEEICGTWVLEKRIPVAAGLGGGSSDAAAALRLLQRWRGNPFSSKQLVDVALHVGSDVPFFLFGGLARGRGRGELLARCAWPGKISVVLVVQKSGLSTKMVYESLGRELTGQEVEHSLEKEFLFAMNGKGETGELPNDLADPVYFHRPDVREVVNTLSGLGLSAVGVSGSGPTVFGLTRSNERARLVASQLRETEKHVLATRLRRRIPPVRELSSPQLEADWGVVKR